MGKDIIKLLPDGVANQIAAGEVVQRPASVVKELMENAVDAGATSISVEVKEAGRGLICVSDNGCGMSASDARMAFERHATSKIRSAEDLFSLQTMGFRGEALPSIVAVSQVELKTCQRGEELGIKLCFSGSKLESQEYIQFPAGTCFSVRNLFFNVPVRRNFLKSNQRELSCIVEEFEKIALANTTIEMHLISDGKEIYNLKPSNVLQRIVGIFGKHFKEVLLPVEVETSMLNLKGYVCNPQGCIRKNLKQFFFVNGRYMRHAYFHKAVLQPYEGLIQNGEAPHYFLFFDVAPETIDVNIHPSKTEISFENASPIWQMISAAVKATLGRNNAVPSIDFNQEDVVEIPPFRPTDRDVLPPKINVDTSYNPFKSPYESKTPSHQVRNWEQLYPHKRVVEKQESIAMEEEEGEQKDIILPFRGKYMLLQQKEGLMIIHIRRAMQRVLYEGYLKKLSQRKECGERMLFPEMLQFSASDSILLDSILDELFYIGFDISSLGGGSYAVNSTPEGVKPNQEMFDMLLEEVLTSNVSVKEELHKKIALSLCEWVVRGNKEENFSSHDLASLKEHLFATTDPYHTPKGKKIFMILGEYDMDKMLD